MVISKSVSAQTSVWLWSVELLNYPKRLFVFSVKPALTSTA